MQVYAAGHEPDAFALGHFRGLGDLGESENARVKGAGAVFAGDGDGDLYVVDVEDWHARNYAACLARRGWILRIVRRKRWRAARTSYCSCQFIQKSSDMPQKRASLTAVSAVMPRRSNTMSFMRGAGT